MIPGYDTKTTPAPKPIRVDPQATQRVTLAVAPTIFESNLDYSSVLGIPRKFETGDTHSANQKHNLFANQYISTMEDVTQATCNGERDR